MDFSLDKLKKICYNSLIIEGEDTERQGIIRNEAEEKDVCKAIIIENMRVL